MAQTTKAKVAVIFGQVLFTGEELPAQAPSLTASQVTGTFTSKTAAALIAHGFAAFPLVTIGVTNADVTSNSHADDGAADQGMGCT
ncbi:hypothetical protein ACK1VC_02290 [Pseudomonas sp. XP2]|uniref:Phage tail protein n=1 Tax=Pseudomonas putida TaxID=303 RepID=A0ABD7BD68_PSEPU|nr:hypothetical protein [Pseudomonas putida]QOC97466.1 hypothetical protein ID616_26040 [Pseudomonas putida]